MPAISLENKRLVALEIMGPKKSVFRLDHFADIGAR